MDEEKQSFWQFLSNNDIWELIGALIISISIIVWIMTEGLRSF